MNASELHTDILLLIAGDRQAFERIYHLYWNKIYSFAGLYLQDKHEQEEVVQQVFIRLWDIRENLTPSLSLDGLLFVLTRNLGFNHRRHSLNEQAMKDSIAKAGIQTDDIQSNLEEKEFRLQLEALINALPLRQQQAVRLYYDEGQTYEEISKKMGISKKGVERSLYLARKFLKENLPLFLVFLSI